MKKLTILLMVVGFLIGCSAGPFSENGEAQGVGNATSEHVVMFRGDVELFYEEFDNPWWYSWIEATVETNTGEIYALIYSDKQPLAKTKSAWRQFTIYPEISTWTFVDEDNVDRVFEATGKITYTQLFIDTPTPGRAVGVYDITGGTWEGKEIIRGNAHFNLILEKDEFFSKFCTPDNPCYVSGTIKGVFHVSSDLVL
jgi:hypothetical protein